MKVYTLTGVGHRFASTPSHEVGTPMRILYFMRRNHGMASDELIKEKLSLDGMELRLAMNELMRHRAVTCNVEN